MGGASLFSTPIAATDVGSRKIVEVAACAPAGLFALGDPFLQPERRAVARSVRLREVRHLVRERVGPRIPAGHGARRDHRDAAPFRDRDRSRLLRRRFGQPGHRREREQIAHELDVQRARQVDLEIARECLARGDRDVDQKGASARSLSSCMRMVTPRAASTSVIAPAVARAQPAAMPEELGAGVGALRDRLARAARPALS